MKKLLPNQIIMAKKNKQAEKAAKETTLLDEIQGKITESLKDFPTKAGRKKYMKTVRKAGKILASIVAKDYATGKIKKVVKKVKVNKPALAVEEIAQ